MTNETTITSTNMPVFLIGAGNIVTTAHLPAYELAGFTVAGIYDIDEEKAADAAKKYFVEKVFAKLEDMLQVLPTPAVIDIAVPGNQLTGILEQLPDRSVVLMQKPMGSDLEEAREILRMCRQKKITAGVNFQLRYAPFITAAREMIASGRIGVLHDLEINVNVSTPWQTWGFLFSAPRVEILYHSIHYIDLVRSFLGNPVSVYAKTTKHPAMPDLASVRTNIIMDYGDLVRANILTNHGHDFGPEKQQSYIKFEGDKGAIRIGMGLLKNYPKGEADTFEYYISDEPGGWKSLQVEGSWFPHAFIGSMQQLMQAAGTGREPDNSVTDAINTMACVEACYRSSEMGGVRPDYVDVSK